MTNPTSVDRYDPAKEMDPLIQRHIKRDPYSDEAVFAVFDYPVWAVVLNLRATDYDWKVVQATFPELPREALEAAERFWQKYPHEMLDHLEPAA